MFISLLSGQTIRNRFILEGHKAAETLALQSTLTLLYQSAENGREYAETLLSAPDVLGVAVFDLTNTPLLALGEANDIRASAAELPKEQPITIETESSWYFLAPVYTNPAPEQAADSPFTAFQSEPELLGYAQVVMGKDTLKRVTGDILWTNFLVSGALAITLLIVLLFITGRVTHPIKMLAETMRRSTMGERRIRAEISGSRDVSEMQHAFNKMMEGAGRARKRVEKGARYGAESARIRAGAPPPSVMSCVHRSTACLAYGAAQGMGLTETGRLRRGSQDLG